MPHNGTEVPAGGPVLSRQTNSLAVAALICAGLELVVGITFLPAIVLGHIARRQIRRDGSRGSGLALTALVLGYLGLAVTAAIIGAAILTYFVKL
jgi:hypothetical protein